MAGIPKYTRGISQEFLKNGHEVFVLCEKNNGNKKVETIENIKIFRHKTSDNLRENLNLIKERAKEIKESFDLILILWYKYFRPIKEVFSNTKKIYVVPSVRKIDIKILNRHNSFFRKQYYYFINRYSITLEKEAIFESDGVVALGKQMNKQLEREYGFNKAKILNPGVDRKKFRPKRNKKENIFLIVANLDPRKGIDRAIKVARFLRNGKIKVLGGGKRMELYKKQIRDFGVEKKIILNGPTDKVCEEMVKSRALLMTSYSEGFPLIYPEALASGLPIIAFKSDDKEVMNASNEVIINGINGFLVNTEEEMAKEIERLTMDNSLQKKLSNGALKQSLKFTWEKVARELLSIANLNKNPLRIKKIVSKIKV